MFFFSRCKNTIHKKLAVMIKEGGSFIPHTVELVYRFGDLALTQIEKIQAQKLK